MKDLKITKGEWGPCCKDNRPHFIFVGEDERVVCSMSSNEKGTDNYEPLMEEVSMAERIANAALIADAGNTAQKCGLLPSELLKQRDRCLLALSNCRETIEMLQREIPGEQIVLRHEMASRLKDIEAAITKAEER
jgi:hypothetical protein